MLEIEGRLDAFLTRAKEELDGIDWADAPTNLWWPIRLPPAWPPNFTLNSFPQPKISRI
jgi:hypothetical protein